MALKPLLSGAASVQGIFVPGVVRGVREETGDKYSRGYSWGTLRGHVEPANVMHVDLFFLFTNHHYYCHLLGQGLKNMPTSRGNGMVMVSQKLRKQRNPQWTAWLGTSVSSSRAATPHFQPPEHIYPPKGGQARSAGRVIREGLPGSPRSHWAASAAGFLCWPGVLEALSAGHRRDSPAGQGKAWVRAGSPARG